MVNKRWWWMLPLLVLVAWPLVYFQRQKDSLSGSERSNESSPTSGELASTSRPTGSEIDQEAVSTERKKPALRPKLPKRINPESFPIAVSVPGKTGFVISPYGGHIVDVREIPPNCLIQDPNFPTEERKWFRVPPNETSQGEVVRPVESGINGGVLPDENSDEEADGK